MSSMSVGAREESPRPGTVDTLSHMQIRPPSPSKLRSQDPWLHGTYKTPKGRIITGEDLCQSLERMYTAYGDKGEAAGAQKPAPGTPPPKTMSQEEIDGVVNRLYSSKQISEGDEGKLVRVQLSFGEGGKELWVPVKHTTVEEQTGYMCALYDRCRESKKKTKAALAAKWLKPLGTPRKM